jgi:hypothetical protein
MIACTSHALACLLAIAAGAMICDLPMVRITPCADCLPIAEKTVRSTAHATGCAMEFEIGQRQGGDRKTDQAGNISGLIDKGDTRDIAADKSGIGSGKT